MYLKHHLNMYIVIVDFSYSKMLNGINYGFIWKRGLSLGTKLLSNACLYLGIESINQSSKPHHSQLQSKKDTVEISHMLCLISHV